jgi:hypothetical protein
MRSMRREKLPHGIPPGKNLHIHSPIIAVQKMAAENDAIKPVHIAIVHMVFSILWLMSAVTFW